jgi:hypothetical protein
VKRTAERVSAAPAFQQSVNGVGDFPAGKSSESP